MANRIRVLIAGNSFGVCLGVMTALDVAVFHVCGVVFNSEAALATAGMIPLDLAIVDADLGGAAQGIDLAEALFSIHTVPSFLLFAGPSIPASLPASVLGGLSLDEVPTRLPEAMREIGRLLRQDG